jgi:L-fucose isomerase-like protein
MPQAAPIRSDVVRVRPGRRSRSAFLALASGLLAAGAALAGPSTEYGPEAEARFLELCASASDAGRSACRCVMERVQEDLGYADFLEAASGGPAAFAGATDRRFAAALRRAEAACTTQAALPPADR